MFGVLIQIYYTHQTQQTREPSAHSSCDVPQNHHYSQSQDRDFPLTIVSTVNLWAFGQINHADEHFGFLSLEHVCKWLE